tara:strand:- start:13436 stop:14404 length:969 start_codon:yes stop_codon:yes gene_type:complete
MKKYCFCISAYNESESIENCILSALKASRGFSADVYVLNNGSEDSTENKINELRKIHSFNFMNFQENKTLQEARDFLLRNCDSEYAVFVDADGIVMENYLSILDVYASNDYSIYSGPVLENKRNENLIYELHFKSLIETDKKFLIGANLVVNTKAAILSGGFKNITRKRGDETALIFQMKKDGCKHLFLKDLITTNNFSNNIYDFFRCSFDEGINSFILNYEFSIHNSLIYHLVRSIFTVGIIIFLLGIFWASYQAVMIGFLLILIPILRRFTYWKYAFLSCFKNNIPKRFWYLFCIFISNIILDYGYWYAKFMKFKPRSKI